MFWQKHFIVVDKRLLIIRLQTNNKKIGTDNTHTHRWSECVLCRTVGELISAY